MAGQQLRKLRVIIDIQRAALDAAVLTGHASGGETFCRRQLRESGSADPKTAQRWQREITNRLPLVPTAVRLLSICSRSFPDRSQIMTRFHHIHDGFPTRSGSMTYREPKLRAASVIGIEIGMMRSRVISAP